MMTRRLGSAALVSVAALVSLAVVPAAQATIYVGAWDPLFGSPFTSAFGWRGTVTVNVPGNCGVPIATGTVTKDNTAGNDCDSFGRAYVQSAQVDFYDTTPANPLGSIFWNYTGLGNAESNGVFVNFMEFVDGTLENLRTSELPSQAPPFSVNPTYIASSGSYEFSLQFLQNGIPSVSPPLIVSGYSGPVLFAHRWYDDCGDDVCYQTFRAAVDTDAGQPRNFAFRAVPEPTTMALVASALLVAGAAGRRGRTARAGRQAV